MRDKKDIKLQLMNHFLSIKLLLVEIIDKIIGFGLF